LRPPLSLPIPIDLRLHLTPLSKEDFGRVSRTFIHNGVVVSCNHISVSLVVLSYRDKRDDAAVKGNGSTRDPLESMNVTQNVRNKKSHDR
jgi:hypothetical protein